MTTLSQTDIGNLALSKIGVPSITNITDQTLSQAIALNTNWALSFQECARGAPWNCLRKTVVLQQTTNPTLTPSVSTLTPTPIPWAPLTNYAANVNLTFGGNTYTTSYAYTSNASFTFDLTSGALSLTLIPSYFPFNIVSSTGLPSETVSGWNFAYLLPSDFLLAVMLNDNWCWGNYGSPSGATTKYEVQGGILLTNQWQAILKYTANLTDTTQYDPLFVNTLSFLLASKVATPLRKDDGTLQLKMLQAYNQALAEARTTNANEGSPIRTSQPSRSRWVRSRWFSTAG
jgi:hypothetical protein